MQLCAIRNISISAMYEIADIKNSKGIHIAHFNVRSLMNKWDVFKSQFGDSNIHIMGLSETWLNDKIPSNILKLADDYVLLRNDRNWRQNNSTQIKKGGGVGIFIKSKLNFCESSFKHLNCSTEDIEIQWIGIKQPHSKPIIIGNLYRPPQGNIDNFIQKLEMQLADFNLDRVEMFLMGDFNIDFFDKNSSNYKKLTDFIKPLGLRQIVKKTTRPTLNRNSCIDLIISNSDSIENIGVLDINLSDHLPVICTRKFLKYPKKKCTFIGRSYRNYDAERFQQRIQEADWEEFDNSNTVTDKWLSLENIIRESIDHMCPLKNFKIKQVKEAWVTNELIELIKDKDYAIRRAKKSKDPQLWAEAKRIRNNCTKRIRNARAEFIKDNLNNNINNKKNFWKNLQDILPSKKGGMKSAIKLRDKNTGQFVLENDTASFINHFFVNIGPNLAKKCTSNWNFRGSDCINNIDDISTNTNEIVKLCKNVNINKSSCVDHLSSRVLRDAFLAIPQKVVELFNMSFNKAEIPNSWKIAKVTPLPKAGNSTDVSNLRPVSLLPLMSKLIEKIVHNRIYIFCELNNILDEKQGGFRPKHSTCSTTSYFINDIYTAMNNNEILIATYIDAVKAFDTVNHEILLKKAAKYGIKGNVFLWLKNYLTDRYQCTLANDIVSTTKLITCGVPQGSVCGPLLFLIYINDLSKALTSCKISLYADDTVIYVIHKNLNEGMQLVQNDLNCLYK